MKKTTLSLLVAAVALLVASSAIAYTGTYTPGIGINGTPHDLGTSHNSMNYTAVMVDPTSDPGGRICIFCHAPHNTYRLSTSGAGTGPQAAAEFTYLPLWNHELPNPVPTYAPYTNGAGPTSGSKALNAALGQPNNVSRLCLSCHDGSIAVNLFGNSDQPQGSQSVGTTTIATGYAVGQNNNLTNHHPVSFNYDAVQAVDVDIRSADTAMLTPVYYVRDLLSGAGNTELECSSCHSVHNKGNAGERLLWRSDQNSELCLTCHDKGNYVAP